MSARQPVVSELLADPPLVHFLVERGERRPHVWSTADDCYDFLAEHVQPGHRTLETGLGVSTALFTRLGAHHTAVCSSGAERDLLLGYLDERGVNRDQLVFLLGGSDQVLPGVEGPFDLYLIDGGHGFPMPMIDFYYGARHLREGGVLVMDDINLRPVREVVTFLSRDPRWEQLVHGPKWVAFRRLDDHPLNEEWIAQPFYVSAPKPTFRERIRGKLASLRTG